MEIKPRNFPHPIIAPWSDDVQPYKLDCQLEVNNDKENYNFNFDITSDNEYVLGLLRSGNARFIIHIECGRTFYRHSINVIWPEDTNKNKVSGKIDISAKELVGHTEISFFICADKDISDYLPDGVHADYENRKFKLESGTFIALCKTFKCNCRQDYDALQKISSIISFRKDSERNDGPIKVELFNNKLIGKLPIKLHNKYCELKDRKRYTNILSATLVMPVLMEGLSYMKQSEDPESDYGDYKWFRVIAKKLKDINYDIRSGSALEAAQNILEMPYDRAANELEILNVII
jgi:hypothetical protein